MPTLFELGEELSGAPPYVAYKIMRLMEQRKIDRISIFDVAVHFKDESWFSPNRIYMGLIFLYSLGIADFNPPDVEKNVKNPKIIYRTTDN